MSHVGASSVVLHRMFSTASLLVKPDSSANSQATLTASSPYCGMAARMPASCLSPPFTFASLSRKVCRPAGSVQF